MAGWIVLAGAWVVLAFAYIADSPWLAYLSVHRSDNELLSGNLAHWRVPYLWGVWLLPWLVVPLPFGRDQMLITMLQRGSSQVSSIVLDWFRVPHLMEGNTLILPDKQFFVDEACSGIVSVMSIIACAVIYGVWRNRPPLHLVLLASAGVGWATLMNVVRISVIAIAYHWSGVDWSSGTPHEILGLLIFLITFVALVSTDYALVVLSAPIRQTFAEQFGDQHRYGAWLVNAWDWLQGWGRPVFVAESTLLETMQVAESQGAVLRTQGGVREASPSPHTDVEAIRPTRALATRFVFGVIPLIAFGVLAGSQFTMANWFRQPSAGPSQSLARAGAIECRSTATVD